MPLFCPSRLPLPLSLLNNPLQPHRGGGGAGIYLSNLGARRLRGESKLALHADDRKV